MAKKLAAMFLLIIMLFTVSACGNTGPVFNEIDDIEITYEFSAPVEGERTLESASVHINAQQLALLNAYIKNLEVTDIDLYKDRLDEEYRTKLITALNKKRMQLDKMAEEIFFSNMEIILSEVNDCQFKQKYANERKKDVREFVLDYIKILNIDSEDPSGIDKMIQNYATWDNDFAKNIIIENKDEIIDKAIIIIERNAEAEESFGAYIAMNNETVRAINYLFGGVGDNVSFRKRINDSNYKLLEKTIKAMPDLTDADRESMLAQLRENQRLSDRSNRN